MHVPFVDLGAQYQAHKKEFDDAFASVIDKTAFIGGHFVKAFEKRYAEQYGVKHCISCANGTDAIYIALRMLGVGAGDEVITTAATWISTSETISQTGAKPVFVDVDEHYLIDVEKIESAITPQTRAIIPVHLYGQAVNMGRLMEIARKHNLFVLEDCAQAHFSEWDGQRVGTIGDVATFSFYPGKNLGAWGDAGAIVTNDDALAEKMRMLANHGALIKHQHTMEGINSRLDGLQASLLTAKMDHIEDWTKARQRVAAKYDNLLNGVGDLRLPTVHDKATHVYHLYVINTARRDELKDYLGKHSIQSAIHYPTSIPLLPAYEYLNMTADDIPNAASNQEQILSIPIYPEISDEAVAYVADTIKAFFA
ncbi:MAG: DegT/DnrJ/EryC1/StrS family aminotransferase [Gammaproteobacteria bacterium]